MLLLSLSLSLSIHSIVSGWDSMCNKNVGTVEVRISQAVEEEEGLKRG